MMYLIPKILKDGEVEHDGRYIEDPAPRRSTRARCRSRTRRSIMACTRNDTLVTAGSRASARW